MKAFASLGIDLPQQKDSISENKYFGSETSLPERTRPDRYHLREKKHRALNKGSPLDNDSWEDEDMDDKTRELSFSQDYHDLLADQYQEMNVQAEEVLSSGGAHQVYEAQFEELRPKVPPKDHHARSLPFSRQNCSGQSTPRSQSSDRATEQSSGSGQKNRHKRISSWVPHRLSVAPRRTAHTESSWDEYSDREHRKLDQTPDSEVDEVPTDDLPFSMFFPPSLAIKFGFKHKKKTPAPKAPPLTASPSQATTPLMRLPGGFAVVRRTPSSAPKSDAISDKSPSSEHARGSSQLGSDYSPRTNSDHRSSFASRQSQSPVAPGMAIRNTFRTSGGSSYSQQSSSSHPLAQEMSQPTSSPTLPPAPLPPTSSSPPLSPDAWNSLKSRDGGEHRHHRYKPNFIEKAREARKRHNKEARQDRLKKSIKVLGPTDPRVVSGYVKPERRISEGDSDLEGRLPGYMIGDPL
ncbi:hypothetical protein N0V90_012656 [Kalmusia sp. IMI 367209]|nr:hypothetical protein N0V90_012656 [Kalmusia sp. IMI 367209]